MIPSFLLKNIAVGLSGKIEIWGYVLLCGVFTVFILLAWFWCTTHQPKIHQTDHLSPMMTHFYPDPAPIPRAQGLSEWFDVTVQISSQMNTGERLCSDVFL